MPSTIVYGDAPDTLTWDDARNLVRSDLWRASSQSLPNDVVDRGIHASLRRLEAERRWLWLEEVNATVTAQVDGAIIDLPFSVVSLSHVAYVEGDRYYEVLSQAPMANVRTQSTTSRIGTPTAYNFHGGKLYLDCPVKANDTFELVLKSGVPKSISDAIANPPVTLTLQQAAVMAAACAWIALTRLKNENEAQRHEAAYQSLLETLMSEEDERRTDGVGGVITPDMSYHIAAYGNR